MMDTVADIEADLSAPLLANSSRRIPQSNDPDYFGNFPPEAITVASELWSASVPSIKYYQLCWKLRTILEDSEILRNALHSNSFCSTGYEITDNPNMYRPLFRGIAEGLSKEKLSGTGLASMSDYELFHSLRNENDFEQFSNLLEVDTAVIRQRWISLRSAIKQKQEIVLQMIMIRPSSWINILLIYGAILGCLGYILTASITTNPESNHPPDSFETLTLFQYVMGIVCVLTWMIDIGGSYMIFYQRGDHVRFAQDIRCLSMRYGIVMLLIIGGLQLKKM